jgi:perosamine synthetase
MKSIPVNEPLLNGNEKKYLSECIDTGWISSEGPFVKQFEEQFSARMGCQYGISVSNGSVALQVAIAALDIGLGDEVILPAFTIISCAAAIVYAGATPVVVDCEPDTWNVDVNQIESKITAKTKALMIVHIYGLPVDMQPVLALAEKYGLAIIEDAAEMHGQTYQGIPCGSFGTISTFSFYPNKHITTGEGGMLLTHDQRLAERCRSLRNLCFQSQARFVHEVAQLERLDEFVARKRRMGQLYTELLSGVSGLQLPIPQTDYATNIYWVYGIVLQESMPYDAREAMARLGRHGIGTRPFFWPMHEQPVFQKMGLFEGVSCPTAESIARRGFYIPSGLAITDDQIQYVAQVIAEVLK